MRTLIAATVVLTIGCPVCAQTLPEPLALKIRIRQLEVAVTACQLEAATIMVALGQTRADLIRQSAQSNAAIEGHRHLDNEVIMALGGNPATDRLDWSKESPVLIRAPVAPVMPEP